MKFFTDLRERRLVQIVVSYLVAGFIALEVVGHFVEMAVLPELVYRVALIWYVAGIPAAIVVGWYHGEKGAQGAPRRELLALAILTLSTLAVSGHTVAGHLRTRAALEAAAESQLNLKRIAVAYFEDHSPDQELRSLADGLTENLIDELAQVRGLDVVSRRGTLPFRGSEVAPDSIGRALDAGTVVVGSVEAAREGVRVKLRIVDSQSGTDLGNRLAFTHPADDLFAIRRHLAERASELLRPVLGQEVRLRRTRRAANDPRAWMQLQRAEKAKKDAEALLHRDPEAVDERLTLADELSARAEILDPAWAEPAVLRAEIAYRRARLAHSLPELMKWADVAVGHADRALEKEGSRAAALELRGVARYWKYLQRATPERWEEERLLQQALSDLEEAVRIEPRALAFYALSHAYVGRDATSALIAARNAYEADEFLEEADGVLWRLFTGNFDLEQLGEAQRWCEQGARRFPADHRFATCRLLLLTTPQVAADVEAAQRLVHEIVGAAPEAVRDYQRIQARMMYAGVLARAGHREAALATLDTARAEVSAAIDPTHDLLTIEAAMRVIAGDADGAVRLLRRYASAVPHASFDHHWWWRSLQGHPDLPLPREPAHARH